METTIYNQEGKTAGEITLPKEIFGLPWNADLVHQVIHSMLSTRRTPVAHTKTRGEVRGGGKKPWQQKGTGRARHGSTRSPLWVGGGVTHGPRKDKNYDRKVNRKMKAKALYTLLSKKLRDGEILFMDKISFKEPKAKQGLEIIKNLSSISGFERILSKRKNSAYIALAEKESAIVKSFRNFGNVEVASLKDINPADILNYKYLVITNPKDSVSFLENKMKTKTT